MKNILLKYKFIIGVVCAALIFGAGYWTYDYLALGKRALPYSQTPSSSVPNQEAPASPEPAQETPEGSTAYKIEEVVSGLSVPWSLVWTSPDRMLLVERQGRIRIVVNDQLVSAPLISFPDVSTVSEEGLMGVAVDPAYAENKYLYACYAYLKNGGMSDKVVRIIDEGTSARLDATILDGIPAAQYHAGCRLAFGPDGKLYITTGDATDKNNAQKMDSLGGKILRINADGSIPSDNPFGGSPIWTLGHRNPQGIAWHPQTKEMYETEHGPSVFDGPAGGDEVNRIIRGTNYGWPLVSHEKTREGTKAPLLVFTPAEAPASAAFVSSTKIPQFTNNFFFGGLRGEGIIRVVFDAANPDLVVRYEKLPEVRLGRIRAIAEGPDGYLYFSTSNRDGRGSPATRDDRILRIVPSGQ